MNSEKHIPGWVQIALALIGVIGTVAVAWITMPVKFQGTAGDGKHGAATTPAEPGLTQPPTSAPTRPTTPPAEPAVQIPAPTPDRPAPPAVVPPAAAIRNPFGFKDVFDVEGEDVKAFADKVKVGSISGQNELNAPQWTSPPVPGTRGKLEGVWSSRWRSGLNDPWETGTTAVREVGGRVFVLYSNPKPAYLIEAVRQGKTRLIGRYVNLKSPLRDNSPWVGEIIDDERIDGKWTGGRWDLRRQLRQSVRAGPDPIPDREWSYGRLRWAELVGWVRKPS